MRLTVGLLIALLFGCARQPLVDRLATKDDAYICKYFAQFVFDGDSGKAMAHRQAMRNRGLEKSPDCRMIYESRMTALSARPERRVPWEMAIGEN